MQASPVGYNNDSPMTNLNSGGSKLKPPPSRASYRECLKNHVASLGGHVTDGCGEFMPSGDDGTLEALKCAACNCHRNFHRKEHHGGDPSSVAAVQPLQLPPPLPSPSISHHPVGGGQWGPTAHPFKMSAGTRTGTDSSSEDMMNFNAVVPVSTTKKRFRTKFTAEQKRRMLEFAEKLGWRIPREDDSEMQRFCAEVGVKRQIFKVWMHNNKNSSTKKNPQELI